MTCHYRLSVVSHDLKESSVTELQVRVGNIIGYF